VSAHEVNRASWSALGRIGRVDSPRIARKLSSVRSTRAARSIEGWNPPPDEPNARCPVCFEPVWFFRNKAGGCAYFDAIGKPWPLHPCMALPQSVEGRRAAAEARTAYERALRTPSRFAARRAGRAAVGDSAFRPVGVSAGESSASSLAADGTSGADEPLEWWMVLSGLWALLLSLPVGRWVEANVGWIPPLLSLWAISLPTLCMTLAIGWYLLRAPRPRLRAEDIIGSFLLAPILLLLCIVGNVLSCGVGVPIVALYVVSEANKARRRVANPGAKQWVVR
jgi:hypothetical protein